MEQLSKKKIATIDNLIALVEKIKSQEKNLAQDKIIFDLFVDIYPEETKIFLKNFSRKYSFISYKKQ